MSDLAPETRDRLLAYLREIAPPELVDELNAQVEQQLVERRTNQLAQVLAIAHETVTSRIRVTPEAAASALVDGGGLTPRVAARIAGIPVEQLQAAGDDTSGPEAGSGAVIEGWDDFWSPPPGADTADEARETDEHGDADADVSDPQPTAADSDLRPPPGTVETWAGGSGRDRRSGMPVTAAVGVIGVLVVVLAFVALSDDGGEPLADRIAPPTNPATATSTTAPTADATATDAPATPTGAPPAPGSELAVDAVVVGAPGGGPNRLAAPVPVGFTVRGVDDGPSTLRWELERDGQAVFPAAPLVVPADGDVRLTVPPALLSDPGSYVVRVTDGGTVLLEESFEVVG